MRAKGVQAAHAYTGPLPVVPLISPPARSLSPRPRAQLMQTSEIDTSTKVYPLPTSLAACNRQPVGAGDEDEAA